MYDLFGDASTNARNVFKQAYALLCVKNHSSKTTVVQLCHTAGFNRSTFYANYENIEDLANELIEDILCELQKSRGDFVFPFHQESMKFIDRHSDLFLVLLQDKVCRFFERLCEYDKTILEYFYREFQGAIGFGEFQDIFIDYVVVSRWRMIWRWLERGKPLPLCKFSFLLWQIDYGLASRNLRLAEKRKESE